jgi:two-component system, sensor histidine kinase and response regulator
LLNLISNAIKFSKTGGTITVVLRILDHFEGKDVIMISVIDTGIGIGEEDLKSLFNPFYKSTNEESRACNPSGNSLGLSISRNIAKGQDGDLTVDSSLGIGSTFKFKINAYRVAGSNLARNDPGKKKKGT